ERTRMTGSWSATAPPNGPWQMEISVNRTGTALLAEELEMLNWLTSQVDQALQWMSSSQSSTELIRPPVRRPKVITLSLSHWATCSSVRGETEMESRAPFAGPSTASSGQPLSYRSTVSDSLSGISMSLGWVTTSKVSRPRVGPTSGALRSPSTSRSGSLAG